MSITKLNGILSGNNIQDYCSFEYPWFRAVVRHVRALESCYLVIPDAFGGFDELSFWLEDELPLVSESGRLQVIHGPEGEIGAAVVERLVEEFSSSNRPESPPWFEDLLSAYREENPRDIPPRTFLLLLPRADSWQWLEQLRASQERAGLDAAICIVVTNSPPPTARNVVRYSPPHLFANLERIPDSDRDTAFWNAILNSFIAIWESGGIPEVAMRLNDDLVSSLGTWADAHYSRRRDEIITKHAAATLHGIAAEEVTRLKAWASPVSGISLDEMASLQKTVDIRLWHRGALQYQDGIFDITPMAARHVLSVHKGLSEDERLALKRRRLNNSALARWISGWATTVEENLRQVVLSLGDGRFYNYLLTAPAIGKYRSRLEELQSSGKNRDLGPNPPCIVLADCFDMIRFVTQQPKYQKWQQDLEAWRLARNKVIHERSVDPDVIRSISRMVNLLRRDGFV